MRHLLALLLLLISSGCSAQELSEADLFGVTIGQKVPNELVKGVSTDAPFLLVTVPLKKEQSQSALQDINLFIFPESHVVAGLRGDRAFGQLEACKAAKAVIDADLRAAYPSTYKGGDPRYQYQSKDGTILAVLSAQIRSRFRA
ncbi:MAG: hypothetical protein ACRD2L_05095 [Terriglobia bacterium]